ncbi:extensin-like [Forsythia ovata]|uniref:Extensin-like n=1 Tax=Forsythia ovata TaxID=205694 RepID=A0ABD1QR27_9LAMI
MAQQPRAPAWARFMARAPINPPPPVPIAQPTTTTPAPPPTQPLQPRAPFPQPVRAPVMPSQLSQPQQPTPPPPPAAAPAPPPSRPSAAAPPAPAKSPPRSPVAPPVPAPSTPRRSPISAPPTTAPSPKSSAPPPPPETTTSASKSPIIKTLPNSPIPKAPLTTSTNVQVQSSPIPESPKTKTQAPSSSLPASPVPKPVATGAPKSTPKTVKPLEKTPVQSPKPKTVAPPPSPLTLPPSQIKADSERESKTPTKFEQKDVLVLETIEKLPKLTPTYTQHSSTASNGRQELTKEKVPNNKISDSEKLGMSVITLAGENKGAVMELSPHKKNHSTTNPHSLHKNTHYTKLWNEGEKSSSDEDGRSNKEKNNKAMAMQSPPMTAYVNNNVQGVNNSIFFNGSSTHQNPGVHLTINRKSNGGHGIHHKDHHA